MVYVGPSPTGSTKVKKYNVHMKKNLNVFTLVMGVIFILGLITTAISGNWVAFIWVVIGLLWMGISSGHEVQKEALRVDYEQKLGTLRKERDNYNELYKNYWGKYDAKLQENYDLAQANLELARKNEQLAKQNLHLHELVGDNQKTDQDLGAARVEEQRGVRGNIKIKRKKKAAPEVKTDIQDKS